ncbi:hypothetical protein UlMin_013566 [Ulmus minor]
MGSRPRCKKEDMNKGAWTAQEDQTLTDYVKTHGFCRWSDLPQRAGLNRSGKSCRLRWLNYLRPDIKRGNITAEEEELIIRLHKLLGNRWALIAGRVPGRTDNEIKNYWNTKLGKQVMKDDHPNIKISTSTRNNKPFSSKTTAPNGASNTHVIRTKATKCSSNVFFHKIQNQPQPHLQQDKDKSTSAHLTMFDSDHQLIGYNPVWSSSPNGQLCSTNLEETPFSDLLNSDFSGINNNFDEKLEALKEKQQAEEDELMLPSEDNIICSFNQEQIGFSDILLNSDFSCFNNNIDYKAEAPKENQQAVDDLIMFSEEELMLQDWTTTERNSLMDPNFDSLASFLGDGAGGQ